jgi:uncharacterized integral membrane protein
MIDCSTNGPLVTGAAAYGIRCQAGFAVSPGVDGDDSLCGQSGLPVTGCSSTVVASSVWSQRPELLAATCGGADMQRLKFYLGLVFGITVTVFALQNMQRAEIRLLFWSMEVPLVSVVLGSAVLGAVWAASWMSISRWRTNKAAVTPMDPATGSVSSGVGANTQQRQT